jgi:hypothetical protein
MMLRWQTETLHRYAMRLSLLEKASAVWCAIYYMTNCSLDDPIFERTLNNFLQQLSCQEFPAYADWTNWWASGDFQVFEIQ